MGHRSIADAAPIYSSLKFFSFALLVDVIVVGDIVCKA